MLSPLKLLATLVVSIPFVLSSAGCKFEGDTTVKYEAGRWFLQVAATTDNCLIASGFFFGVDCTISDGSRRVQSLLNLDFALFRGLALSLVDWNVRDPVVIQVPAAATGFKGTYTDGAGVSRPLAITAGLSSLPIDANSNLVAERGMQMVLLDFPSTLATAPGKYTYAFDYASTDNTIKAITVAVILIEGKYFYPPIVPCVTSFAEVSPITMPAASTPVPLAPEAFGVIAGCAGKTYQFLPTAPAAGSVTAVEFYHSGLDHYFVSWVADEIAKLDAGTVTKGWNRTGHTFRAFTSPQTGTSPVCRFYLPPAFGDSHFYGRGTAECNATAAKFPGFVLEDSQFMHLYLPVAGNCPVNTTAVHRVFSNRADTNHRYTTDPQVVSQMVSKGWVAEGDGPDLVVMCEPN